MSIAHFESIDFPNGLTGWIVLALMLPGAIIVFGLMLTYLLQRTGKADVPPTGEPGYYRVLGVDAQTGQKRESLIHAENRMSAEGQARMEGIIVTHIEQVSITDEPR